MVEEWWRGWVSAGTAPKKQTTSRLGGRSTRSGKPACYRMSTTSRLEDAGVVAVTLDIIVRIGTVRASHER